MRSTSGPVGNRDGLQDALADGPFCFQVVSTDGMRVTEPSAVPLFCDLLSHTTLGAGVCNRGCGLRFGAEGTGGQAVLFSCPFGVSNLSRPLNPPHGANILLGGRFFRNYYQFRQFLENTQSAGVNLDRLLDICGTPEFYRPEEVEKVLEIAWSRLRQNPAAIEVVREEKIQATLEDQTTGSLGEHQVELLRQFNSVIMEAETLAALGPLLVQEVGAYSSAQKVSLFIYDADRQEYVLNCSSGLPSEMVPGMRCPVDQGIIGIAHQTHRPVVVRDISQTRLPRSSHMHYRSSSFVCVPLCREPHPLGILNITERATGQPFAAQEVDMLGLLGQSAAGAIERCLARQEIQNARRFSLIDEQTHVGSRRLFNLRLKEEFHRSARCNHALSLALVRLDMKGAPSPENGADPHDAGLRNAAEVLRESIRSFDLVARYSENIFAILFPETTRTEAENILLRLEECLHDAFRLLRKESLGPLASMSISYGLAEYPSEVSTLADLKLIAEQALGDPAEDTETARIDETDCPDFTEHPGSGLEDCLP